MTALKDDAGGPKRGDPAFLHQGAEKLATEFIFSGGGKE